MHIRSSVGSPRLSPVQQYNSHPSHKYDEHCVSVRFVPLSPAHQYHTLPSHKYSEHFVSVRFLPLSPAHQYSARPSHKYSEHYFSVRFLLLIPAHQYPALPSRKYSEHFVFVRYLSMWATRTKSIQQSPLEAPHAQLVKAFLIFVKFEVLLPYHKSSPLMILWST